MKFDSHNLLAYGTITVAPSPDTSGTTLSMSNADAAQFSDPSVTAPYNATDWPTATPLPLIGNSEIIRITAKGAANSGGSGNTEFTIVRVQEGSSARAITIGDQIANTETPKTLTDIESATIVSNGVLLSNIFQAASLTTLSSSATELIRIDLEDTKNIATVTDISCPDLVTIDDTITIETLTALTTIDFSSLVTVTNGLFLKASPITTVAFPSLTTVGAGGIELSLPDCTSLDLSALTSAEGILIDNIGSGIDLDFSALTTLGTIGFVSLTNSVVSIELTNVVSTTGGINISEALLTSLNISSFTTGSLTIGNTQLTSLDLSLMSTGNSGNNLQLVSNLLTSIIISSTLDCTNINFGGNALTQTAVDDILANLDTAGYSNGSLNLSSGTSSTPSSAGLISAGNLTGKGWSVTTN